MSQEVYDSCNAARSARSADARGWQPSERGGEECHQQHAEPEVGHGVEDQRTEGPDTVTKLPAPPASPCAERNPCCERNDFTKANDEQCWRNLLSYDARDLTSAVFNRIAEVTAQRRPNICDELVWEERLI